MGKLAVCEGEVVTVDGKRSTIGWYSEEFVLSDRVGSLEQARSILQAGLVAERLREKMAGFRRVRTCQVVEFASTDKVATGGEVDELMLEATELGCVPEQLERYATPESKARALKTAIEKFKQREKSASKKKKNEATVAGGEFIDG